VSAPGLDAKELALDPQRAVVLIVDVQERLAAAMPPEIAARAEKNIALLIEAAGRFALPVVATEQYPKGLGKTTEAIEAALAPLGAAVRRIEKLEFSACAASSFAAVWDDIRRDQWIVAGMEAHVCVYQTVRALVGRGAIVHVPVDTVVSRTKANWRIGLDLMSRGGAVLTSTEVVVFDLLKRAGTDDFKALSRLIK
jgi:nicotinamidase-related amidase